MKKTFYIFILIGSISYSQDIGFIENMYPVDSTLCESQKLKAKSEIDSAGFLIPGVFYYIDASHLGNYFVESITLLDCTDMLDV